MKRIIASLFILIFTITASIGTSAAAFKRYTVSDVFGSVTVKGRTEALKVREAISENDILVSKKQAVVKVNDQKKSYTLRFNGSHSVKQLIASIPNKYKAAISNIENNIAKSTKSSSEYGVVTMKDEVDLLNLNENEAVLFCKEDSIGNLSVIFMRYGMENPIMAKINQTTYLNLLKTAIITAEGNDYAYTSTLIYNALWKPFEKELKQGDTILYSFPAYLSAIDMSKVISPEGTSLNDVFTLYDIQQ